MGAARMRATAETEPVTQQSPVELSITELAHCLRLVCLTLRKAWPSPIADELETAVLKRVHAIEARRAHAGD